MAQLANAQLVEQMKKKTQLVKNVHVKLDTLKMFTM